MLFVLQTALLQHVAGVKIVAHLWGQPDIFTQIAQLFNGLSGLPRAREDTCKQKWKAIEEKVKSKVWALPLPPLCKQQLLNIIKPIGAEIMAWCHYHIVDGYSFKIIDNLLPQQFCWSTHGTIDYAKTAELMVKDERVDVARRYEIACYNCLEDETRELFEKLDEAGKGEWVPLLKHVWRRNRKLVRFFNYTLSGDVDQLNRDFLRFPGESINKELFRNRLRKGNPATCEYFFKKLKPEEKNQVLNERDSLIFRTHRQSAPTCGLYYLSRMNEEQRGRLFRERTSDVMICLLGWPLHALFMEAAERGWQFMGEYNCAEVLNAIIVKINLGFRDYHYSQLFWKCWRLTPANYKQFYLDDLEFLKSLFKSKEAEFIKLVLNQARSYRIKALFAFFQYKYLPDKRVISDAALMECKQAAVLNSSNDKKDVEKRLRSKYVCQMVNSVMERRNVGWIKL